MVLASTRAERPSLGAFMLQIRLCQSIPSIIPKIPVQTLPRQTASATHQRLLHQQLMLHTSERRRTILDRLDERGECINVSPSVFQIEHCHTLAIAAFRFGQAQS